MIQSFAEEYPVNQLSIVDKSLLRIAFWEVKKLRKSDNFSKLVEDFEKLGYLFGSDNSNKFIKGVLKSLIKNLDKIYYKLNESRIIMATIEERLYEIIAESLSVSIDDIKPDSSFIDDLDADSLDVVEMIMAMESEFSSDGNDLEISDEEAESIITVADALKFLDEKGISD